MAKITKPGPRARRPKAEIQQEFASIQEGVSAARETADAKSDELRKSKETEVLQSVDGVSVEAVVERISGLGLEISRALSGVSSKLVEEVERLAAVREAIRIEREELSRLHKIDVAATAVDQLVQDHAREKERLDAEIAAQRAQWEEELARRTAR